MSHAERVRDTARLRPALLGGAVLLALLAGAVPGASAQSPPPSPCPDANLAPGPDTMPRVQAALVCVLNEQRRSAGLASFARVDELDTSSAFQSADMVDSHYFGHEESGHPTLLERVLWTGYFDGAVGGLYSENLAFGPIPQGTAAAIVNAWMQSSDHRANILDSRLDQIGVGTALTGPDPAFYPDRSAAVFTTDFGRRDYPPAGAAQNCAAAAPAPSSSSAVPGQPWCPPRRTAAPRSAHHATHHASRRVARPHHSRHGHARHRSVKR